MAFPNLIIAGPPKAGTTSVFRYLAAHPDVSPSSIKEIHFFEQHLNAIDEDALKHYESFFKSAGNEKIRLEASPRYMQGGEPIASAIHQHLPDAKIVFILREPTSRFLSRYISLITKTDRIPEHYHDLDTLVDSAIAHPQAQPDIAAPELKDEIVEYLWQGCYAAFIQPYLDRFPKEQIGLFYFDDLNNDPKSFMVDFCRFLDIDSTFYDNFQFRIENKTRTVRFPALHKLAERTNRQLEGIQNRFPALRRAIKSIYYAILNPETSQKDSIKTDSAKVKLNGYYAPHNARLLEIVRQHSPERPVPSWLSAE